MIPLGYEDPIHAQLRTGEKLLWVGRPRHGLMVRSWDSFLFVFGIAWLIVAWRWLVAVILWAAGELGFDERHAGPRMYHTAIVVAGVVLFIQRFFTDARRRGLMWYALTDRRALFIMTARNTSAIGIEYHEMKDVTLLREFPDGWGTIQFTRHEVDPYAASSDVMNAQGAPHEPMFEAIPDAKAVHALIEQTRTAAVKRRMELMRKGFAADLQQG